MPIGYVEQRFTSIEALQDLTVWRRSSELVDDEVVLYVVGTEVPLTEVRAVSEQLPKFMRPSAVVRIQEMPRDTGVGEISPQVAGDDRTARSGGVVTTEASITNIVEGLVDFHIHSAPSIVPRHSADPETLNVARSLGVRTFVLKAHEGSSADRARVARP